MLIDLREHVALLCVLHDEADGLGAHIDEGLLIADDVVMLDTSEQPDLIESILLIFLGQAI